MLSKIKSWIIKPFKKEEEVVPVITPVINMEEAETAKKPRKPRTKLSKTTVKKLSQRKRKSEWS